VCFEPVVVVWGSCDTCECEWVSFLTRPKVRGLTLYYPHSTGRVDFRLLSVVGPMFHPIVVLCVFAIWEPPTEVLDAVWRIVVFIALEKIEIESCRWVSAPRSCSRDVVVGLGARYADLDEGGLDSFSLPRDGRDVTHFTPRTPGVHSVCWCAQ
jgi:hypothetical protein